MLRRRLNGADVPTPMPWCVREEARPGASPEVVMFGLEPATDNGAGGGPYLIRQNRPVGPGEVLRQIATGIHHLADAKLMVAAPDLAAALLKLLTSPDLMVSGLDPNTRRTVTQSWDLLVRAAPHLKR